jgi:hypothetical protein
VEKPWGEDAGRGITTDGEIAKNFTLLLFFTNLIPSGFDASLAVATWLIGFARMTCPPREGPISYFAGTIKPNVNSGGHAKM